MLSTAVCVYSCEADRAIVAGATVTSVEDKNLNLNPLRMVPHPVRYLTSGTLLISALTPAQPS